MIDPTADEDTSSLFLIMHQHISSNSCSLATDKECLYTEQIMTTSHSFHTLDQLHWLWCCVNLRSRNAVYQLYFQLYSADAWAAVNLACNCPCRLIFWGFSEINIGKTRTTNLNCLLKSVVVFLFFFLQNNFFKTFFYDSIHKIVCNLKKVLMRQGWSQINCFKQMFERKEIQSLKNTADTIITLLSFCFCDRTMIVFCSLQLLIQTKVISVDKLAPILSLLLLSLQFISLLVFHLQMSCQHYKSLAMKLSAVELYPS